MSNRVIYYNIQAFRSAKMKEQADKNQRDKRIHPQLFTFPSTVTFHGQTSLKQEKEYFHLIHQVDVGRTTTENFTLAAPQVWRPQICG